MASIGSLKHVGVYVQNTPVAQSSGGYKDSYTNVLTTRGELKARSSSKEVNAGQVEFRNTFDWTCRFRPDLVINKKSKWVIEGKEYNIEGYELIDMKKCYYKFRLSEVE